MNVWQINERKNDEKRRSVKAVKENNFWNYAKPYLCVTWIHGNLSEAPDDPSGGSDSIQHASAGLQHRHIGMSFKN